MTTVTYPHGTATRYRQGGCRCMSCRAAAREKVAASWALLIARLKPGHWGEQRLYAMGCRCDSCREAHRQYQIEIRAVRAGTLAPGDPRHGRSVGFDHFGCRCDLCLEAKRLRNNKYYERMRTT